MRRRARKIARRRVEREEKVCVFTHIYKKNFLKRFDKDGAIPYYTAADFDGLNVFCGEFENSLCVKIKYFFYSYVGYKSEKLIVFCPGMGAGHAAYLGEIERFCRAGYRVLTLDYTGCGESGGKIMPSVNAPTRDVIELIAALDIEEELIVIGHSLGGYTALNVANLLPRVKRAVVISAFMSISDEMIGFFKLRAFADTVKRFESRLDPVYGNIDNLSYIARTTDKLLWIHSIDDPIVNYEYNAGQAAKAGNPNVKVVTVNGKKHNPYYTFAALKTMNEQIGEYERLIKSNQLKTLEERKAFFADKPIKNMTEHDQAVFDEILSFIR